MQLFLELMNAEEKKADEESFHVTYDWRNRQKQTRSKFNGSDSVFALEKYLVDQEGIPADDMVLRYMGKPLKRYKTLREYGINGKLPVYVTFRVMGGCFVNGTMVSVAKSGINNKSKKIEEFKCGDSVLSYNLSSKEFEESIIENVLLFEVNTLVKIKFNDKSDDIVCTPTHPFWCNNKQMYCCVDNDAAHKIYDNNNFKFGKLCIGDELLNDKLELVCISSIIFNKPMVNNNNNVSVRTFSLNGINNNFFANGKLVHNKGGASRSKSGPDVDAVSHIKTGKNDYFYYNVSPGLNYGGKCNESTCRAYTQPVIFQKGFGEKIDPIDEGIDEEIKCPGCKQPFELKQYFLYKCDCKIRYKKKDKDIKETFHYPRNENVVKLGVNEIGKEVDDDYEYLKFNVYKENTLKYCNWM